MNKELIKRIELALRFSDSEIVSDVLEDCRAALTKKYVPMNDVERNEMMAVWHENSDLPPMIQYVESEVIRRAGLEVQE